jgi:hypothetical protein
MQGHEKANTNASTGRPPVIFSAEARYVSGAPLTADGGGMVADGRELYSVAVTGMVPGAPSAEQQPDGSWRMPAIRTGRAKFLEASESKPTTYGAELEAVRLDADGNYAPLPKAEQDEIRELYSFMLEAGTAPTNDPQEFEDRFWDMVHTEVDAAQRAGQYVAALSVFGQHDFGPQDTNSHPYVSHIVGQMTARTGFAAASMFRTAGAQAHTGISDTMAAVKAAEAMQYLSPILAAPTLSGPFVLGGVAGNLGTPAMRRALTPAQQEHIRASGIDNLDMTHPFQSWRYLLRSLGSPSAGVWRQPPADTQDAYVARAHAQLEAGEINNIDRTNGWHTDRVRVVLDGSGANTIEDCSADTALGNPTVLVPLHLLRSGLTTALEKMAMQGRDPRLVVASMLGTAGLSRAARLQRAHTSMLRETSRYGNDALVYDRTPGQWLGLLLRLANTAPYTYLTTGQKQQLRNAFATQEETEGALRRWCRDHNTDTPTVQAWFDTGLNNPAVYMGAHYKELRRQDTPPEEAARQVELSAGQALHQASHRAREKARS